AAVVVAMPLAICVVWVVTLAVVVPRSAAATVLPVEAAMAAGLAATVLPQPTVVATAVVMAAVATETPRAQLDPLPGG
ncbi:hypothetical protein KXV34_008060, partial [Aspergillus fumigatus]